MLRILGDPRSGASGLISWPAASRRSHDPDSDLYAESSDADTVIGYIAAHASDAQLKGHR